MGHSRMGSFEHHGPGRRGHGPEPDAVLERQDEVVADRCLSLVPVLHGVAHFEQVLAGGVFHVRQEQPVMFPVFLWTGCEFRAPGYVPFPPFQMVFQMHAQPGGEG